jgi:phosphopantetheinyl transferase
MLKGLIDEGMSGLMDEWEYNEHGKPSFRLSPFASRLYFSISHCKQGIAVATDDRPIGIDIEGIRHADADLIARTMSEEEREGMDERKFTRLWTQKEAVVKAQGVGIQSFEQLQNLLENDEWKVESFESEKYIYSVAHK